MREMRGMPTMLSELAPTRRERDRETQRDVLLAVARKTPLVTDYETVAEFLEAYQRWTALLLELAARMAEEAG